MNKYSDLNAFFTTSDIRSTPVLTDIENIKQALERLFTIGKGEVPFNRDYGTTLKSLLFENNVDAEDVKMFLYMDITDFEPRVELSPNDISIVKIDNNSYEVSCNFIVPSLNNKASTATAVLVNDGY